MSKNEKRETVIGYFVEELGLEEAYVRSGEPLFTTGKLDSLEVVKLMLFLEAKASISLNPLDISFEQLDTVDKIMELDN